MAYYHWHIMGILNAHGLDDDAHCETLALLADALLVLDQLVDERLKQKPFKKLKNDLKPLNIPADERL